MREPLGSLQGFPERSSTTQLESVPVHREIRWQRGAYSQRFRETVDLLKTMLEAVHEPGLIGDHPELVARVVAKFLSACVRFAESRPRSIDLPETDYRGHFEGYALELSVTMSIERQCMAYLM